MEGEIYLIPLTIEDLRFLCGVADPLQKSGLARICPSHHENSKAPELRPDVLSRFHVVLSSKFLAAGES
jgi:hypothetical protein